MNAKHLSLLALLLSLPGAVHAAAAEQGKLDPFKSPVFRSGLEGYKSFRIPAAVVSTNGVILAFCEGRRNSASDAGAIEVLLKRSSDNGHSWNPIQVIWSDGPNTCGNPAPVVDRSTGTIWLLMTHNLGSDTESQITRGTSKGTRGVFITHSTDNGLHWSAPNEITATTKKPDWYWYATGPVNGIQLQRGIHKERLVIPANHSELRNRTNSVTRSHVLFSDDHGATWHIGGSEDEKTNESTVVERADGSLLQNMRSYHGKHRRAVATSLDGGASWSPVHLDPALIEPVCQASILRCTWPENGAPSRILFSNPASMKRENLTIRLSYDEGDTWPESKVLHTGPAAYSNLLMLPGGEVACLYESGDHDPYEQITFASFPVSWVESSAPSSR